MRSRHVTLLGLAATATVVAAAAALGQGQTTGSNTAGPAKTWTLPRTPDGQPDLQGIWTNYTATPFEVPDKSDTPDFYAGDLDGTGRGTGSGFLNDSSDRELTKNLSLVIDPPNGRVPIMPWAEERRNYKLTHIQDHWENHTAWERCITRGVPGGIFPAGYGSGYQILQSRGHVAIVYEMIHEARIIPIDGRQQSAVPRWHGDSRGHWDGDTLVVETARFSNKTNFRGSGEGLRLVERYQRVNAGTLLYQVRIEDPTTWTRPWTVQIPMTPNDEGFFEYACHEGNHGLQGILKGSRLDDKLAAEAVKTGTRP